MKKIIFSVVLVALIAISLFAVGCTAQPAAPAASEAPASEAPASDAPASEAPASEAPASEAPAEAPADAPTASSVIVSTDPTFPSGEEVYVRTEYKKGDSQFQLFEDEMKKQNLTGELLYVVEIDAYEKHLNEWMSVVEGIYNLTLPLANATDGQAVTVMQNNKMTGGVIVHPADLSEVKGGNITVSLQKGAAETNNFGLGLFGFIADK